ncbi:hypothetical protein WN51_04400 [Melipona quadrifasciata]|uniref:Uncharacterized protein n=1 Tax=Melipona quadrifasciata TaxID=166423 RepID=A0A0M8ZW70_9HYME|nr:hypothetical protein WN51_04400 [Melipona quadrifasciata]
MEGRKSSRRWENTERKRDGGKRQRRIVETKAGPINVRDGASKRGEERRAAATAEEDDAREDPCRGRLHKHQGTRGAELECRNRKCFGLMAPGETGDFCNDHYHGKSALDVELTRRVGTTTLEEGTEVAVAVETSGSWRRLRELAVHFTKKDFEIERYLIVSKLKEELQNCLKTKKKIQRHAAATSTAPARLKMRIRLIRGKSDSTGVEGHVHPVELWREKSSKGNIIKNGETGGGGDG